MPHVAFVPLIGFRIVNPRLLELGLTLPGLAARGNALSELPALGLLTLAGLLPDDWTASYHAAPAVTDALIAEIIATQPALVAVSALTASVPEAYRLSDRLRTGGCRTVLGGLHATACPDEAGRHFDSVVIGDGEPVWPALLTDAARDRLRPQYYASDWKFPETSPIPRWSLIPGGRLARYTLQTQRGCPLACSFCAASRLLGRYREKPVAQVRRDLTAIREHSGPHRPLLELADDNSFAGPTPRFDLLETLADSGLPYFTENDWRLGERPELLARLARSGCRQVLIGVESLVFRYPGMGGKQAEFDRICRAIDAIQQAGVSVNACFIVGADGETRQSLDRLAQFLETADFADVQVTLQTPFPGTALYRQLQRQGRLRWDQGWSAYTLFDVTYQPDAMTVPELETGFLEVLQRVYADGPSRQRQRLRNQIWRIARPRNPREESSV